MSIQHLPDSERAKELTPWLAAVMAPESFVCSVP